VNKPRYRRNLKGGRLETDRGQGKPDIRVKKMEPRVRKVWRKKGEMSYAQAIKNGTYTKKFL